MRVGDTTCRAERSGARDSSRRFPGLATRKGMNRELITVIEQRVRDAEREGIYSEFAGKEGQIVRGVVHRIEKRNVILELGKAEAILPEREQIPGERYNPGDRVRAFVLEVRRTAKGPLIS